MASKQHSVQPYNFTSLVPSQDGHDPEKVVDFEFSSLAESQKLSTSITPEIIRIEREQEQDKLFNILETVKEHRGLKQQAQDDYEKRVQDEVDRILAQEREKAYKEGFDKGMAEGLEEIKVQASDMFTAKIEEFSAQIEVSKQELDDSLLTQQNKIYETVKNLVKWVCLKEVDNAEYIERVLEKLILEINAKNNLVIRVNKDYFNQMDEILQSVEKKVGKLTNVRVEADLDLHDRGIILESENGIIDGSLVAQFNTLDKMFELVGVDAKDEV
jgi:flagellar assembly protein FliH